MKSTFTAQAVNNLRVIVSGVLAMALSWSPTSAQAHAIKLRLATEVQCMKALGNGAACMRWFAEAERRSQRNGPRFDTQLECEEQFGACAVRRERLGALLMQFSPILSGIEVTIADAKLVGMKPLVGTRSGRPRPVIRTDRTVRAATLPNTSSRQAINSNDPEVSSLVGDVATYPVPVHRRPKRLPESVVQ
jgi:hypothetical protein